METQQLRNGLGVGNSNSARPIRGYHLLKIEFICLLSDNIKHGDAKLGKQCMVIFTDQWIMKIKEDDDLNKFYEHCRKYWKHDPHPVFFMRSLFRDFEKNCKEIRKTQTLNIGSEKELMEILESKLGRFCGKLLSQIPPGLLHDFRKFISLKED